MSLSRFRPLLPAALCLLATACGDRLPDDPQLRAGRQAFEVCAYCHNTGPRQGHKVGPNLYGVVGRRAGSAPGYDYSDALRASEIVWDAAQLDAFLRNPPLHVPGTRMVNATVDPARRAAVIDYLTRLPQVQPAGR